MQDPREFIYFSNFRFLLEFLSIIFDQEELKEWDQCLLMLGDAKVDEHGNITDTRDLNIMYLDKDGEDREINVSCPLQQNM